jgi:hypothetical protein
MIGTVRLKSGFWQNVSGHVLKGKKSTNPSLREQDIRKIGVKTGVLIRR